MRNIKRIENTLPWKLFIRLHRLILGGCCLALVIGITAAVVFRYILKTDIFGLEEIEMLLAMWMYFIGGSYGSYERTHITADITDTLVKNKKKLHYIKIFVTAVSFAASVFLAIWSLKYFDLVLTIGGYTTGLKMPVLWLKLPMMLGCVTMALFNLYQFICELLNIKPIIMDPEEPVAAQEEVAV